MLVWYNDCNIQKVGLILGKLLPDRIFADIYHVTPEFLAENGICALILDIDNTLVTYDDPEPTPPIIEWFRSMENAGIKLSFVSNNNVERVELFNKNLGYYAKGKGKKPFGKYIRKAMDSMGSTPSTTALIGDQIFTDVFAGKCHGLRSFLVPPIKDKLTPFFRAKRFLEKPIISKYYRIHKGERRER